MHFDPFPSHACQSTFFARQQQQNWVFSRDLYSYVFTTCTHIATHIYVRAVHIVFLYILYLPSYGDGKRWVIAIPDCINTCFVLPTVLTLLLSYPLHHHISFTPFLHLLLLFVSSFVNIGILRTWRTMGNILKHREGNAFNWKEERTQRTRQEYWWERERDV